MIEFKGYSTYLVNEHDAMRLKWERLLPQLHNPLTVELKNLHDIAEANARINTTISYNAEPAGKDDWQTPDYTWNMGFGDCEDFAILKYTLLKAHGIEACVVMGHIARLAPGNSDHAWCGFFYEGEWRVLDKLFDHIILAADYINWIPAIAMNQDHVIRYGRSFVINEMIEKV